MNRAVVLAVLAAGCSGGSFDRAAGRLESGRQCIMAPLPTDSAPPYLKATGPRAERIAAGVVPLAPGTRVAVESDTEPPLISAGGGLQPPAGTDQRAVSVTVLTGPEAGEPGTIWRCWLRPLD